MKTKEILIIGCMLMLLIIQSCRSRMVNSERNRTKLEQKEKVKLNSQQSEVITGNRVVQVTDSSSRFFSVEIFPLDTFSFSVNGGFRGRAKKIVLVGTGKDFQRVSDSVGFTDIKTVSVEYRRENEMRQEKMIVLKELKSRRSSWLQTLLWIGCILIICYISYRLRYLPSQIE